jgi:hypothetical protein
VVTDDRGSQYVAALNGFSLIPIAVLDRSINFGPAQATPVTKRFTIYNKGDGSLLVSSILQGAVTSRGSYGLPTPADPSTFSWKDGTGNSCIGTQIPTGGYCVVEVTFTAPANQAYSPKDPSYRVYDAELQIIDNDLTSPQTVSLQGNNLIVIQ